MYKKKIMFGGKLSVYKRKEVILQPGELRGYYHVTLRKDNKSKIFKVHRLILQTFYPNSNSNNLQVNHKDGIKSNNHIDNLEWITPQSNQLHRYQFLYNYKKISKYSYITKNNNKWRLRGAKNIHIGYYNSEEEAINALNIFMKNSPELFKV